MRQNIYFIAFLMLSIIYTGCGLVDNFDTEAMFIEVSDVSVSTNQNQGSSSHNIKDVWIIEEGQSTGVHEIPTNTAILSENQEIEIIYQAAIRKNGVSSDLAVYPFLENITETILYQPSGVVNKTLEFKYRDNAIFSFIEGFEQNHQMNFDADENAQSFMQKVTTDAKDGLYSGYYNLTDSIPSIEVATDIIYDSWPQNSTPVYLELDYKNDIPFDIGLIGYFAGSNATAYYITITEREDWNKIYVDLTDLIASSQLEGYRVVFRSVLDTTTLDSGNVFIDNLKVLHF